MKRRRRVKLRRFFFSGRYKIIIDFLLKCHSLIKMVVHIRKGGC